MSIDGAQAGAILAAVPFARTLGLEFVELRADGDDVAATVRLPDSPALHNHVGGPHAGALFTLGESASGAVVLAAFADQLQSAVPLTRRAEIAYRRLAMGPVLARAVLRRPVADVVADLAGGRRPEIPIEVTVSTEDGTVVAELTVVWTLRAG